MKNLTERWNPSLSLCAAIIQVSIIEKSPFGQLISPGWVGRRLVTARSEYLKAET